MKIFKTKKYSILSNILKLSFVFILFLSLISPIYFIKAEDVAGGDNTGGPAGGENTGGITVTTTITNPLGNNITDLPSFIEAIINIVLVVGVPIVALAIIFTGFLFVEARGNPEKLKKAKNALLYTLIGGALLLGAFVIARAIGTTVEDIKSTT